MLSLKATKTSTLDRHADLPDHKQATKDLKMQETMKRTTMNALAQKTDSLMNAMTIVYYLAKQNIPSLKYESMLDLFDFRGVDVSSMRCGDNATYSSRATVDDFQVRWEDCGMNDGLTKMLHAFDPGGL